MRIGEALVQLIGEQTSVTSLLSSSGAVAADKVDQKTKPPYVRVDVLEDDPFNSLSGMIGGGRANVDFDCVATTVEKSGEIATAVAAFLDTHTGAAGERTIIAAVVIGVNNDKEYLAQGAETFKFVPAVNATILYE